MQVLNDSMDLFLSHILPGIEKTYLVEVGIREAVTLISASSENFFENSIGAHYYKPISASI